MGRAKLNMELISKEKSRHTTFKKRKEGLIRKMYEFTTLCDVRACMIIYGPPPDTKPVAWPLDQDEVHRIIDIYKSKNKDSGNKTFGLSDFFHDRKRKIEEEVSKLRKKNMEAKYPTWLDLLNFMSESQLRDFAAALATKAQYVKDRVDLLKRRKSNNLNHNVNLMAARDPHATFYSPPPCYPAAVDVLNQNSMMMLLMNERQVIYEASSSSGVADPMLRQNARPLASRYYGPPLSIPQPPPYLVAPPPVQYWDSVEVGHENHNVVQYQIKNHEVRYHQD